MKTPRKPRAAGRASTARNNDRLIGHLEGTHARLKEAFTAAQRCAITGAPWGDALVAIIDRVIGDVEVAIAQLRRRGKIRR